MEYKEKYEQLHKFISDLYPFMSDYCKEKTEGIIPELKESGDEKIIRAIKEAVENYWSDDTQALTDILIWLEKQRDERKEINLVEILKHYPSETELYSPLYGKLWLAEVDEEHDIITCYKRRLSEGCKRAMLWQENTVSFYSNGTTGLPDCSVSKDCMLFLYNDEKQGGQKPVDKVEPKFKVGDTIIENDFYDDCDCGTIIDIKDGKYIFDNGCFTCIEEQDLWELVDKPVRPKFKVGDWVVYNGLGTYKVVEIHKEWYSVIDSNDRRWSIMFERESLCHIWTIRDAKDGDILVSGSNRDIILMFRGIGNTKWDDVIDYHYYYDCYREDFIVQEGLIYWGDVWDCQLKPATKEQRDLLFKKMKEAGYEWDAENKELKKIVQKPTEEWSRQSIIDALTRWLTEKIAPLHKKSLDGTITEREDMFKAALVEMRSFVNSPGFQIGKDTSAEWSEEDERILSKIQDHLREFYVGKKGYPYVAKPDSPEMIESDWLDSIKDRVQPQPKQEWSKEDNKMLNNVIQRIKDLDHYWNKPTDEKMIDWLKSLKPNNWKPSEYDISLLEELARNIRNNVRPFCSEVSALEDLIKNIKNI